MIGEVMSGTTCNSFLLSQVFTTNQIAAVPHWIMVYWLLDMVQWHHRKVLMKTLNTTNTTITGLLRTGRSDSAIKKLLGKLIWNHPLKVIVPENNYILTKRAGVLT